jgi:hypothetical protein
MEAAKVNGSGSGGGRVRREMARNNQAAIAK